MLTIWGRLNSHNVKKVVWLAEEIGLDYVRHDVGGRFAMPRPELPYVKAWFDRLRTRPGFATNVMIPLT